MELESVFDGRVCVCVSLSIHIPFKRDVDRFRNVYRAIDHYQLIFECVVQREKEKNNRKTTNSTKTIRNTTTTNMYTMQLQIFLRSMKYQIISIMRLHAYEIETHECHNSELDFTTSTTMRKCNSIEFIRSHLIRHIHTDALERAVIRENSCCRDAK